MHIFLRYSSLLLLVFCVQETTSLTHPKILKYGPIVQLPDAAQQPRDGSRVVVDLTQGGPPEQLFASLEKVARFVNLFAGAGNSPATAEIAVVIHGDATLSVLHAAAYAKRFQTDGNPHLDCLQQLHQAGVQIFVCGQSLAHHGANSADVVPIAHMAVSAMTALVNLQADGYAYVPLK